MTGQAQRRRGQPVIVMCLVMLGWAAMRLALWQSPFPIASPIVKGFTKQFADNEQYIENRPQVSEQNYFVASSAASIKHGLIQQGFHFPLQKFTQRLAGIEYSVPAAQPDYVGLETRVTNMPLVVSEPQPIYSDGQAQPIRFEPEVDRSGWSVDSWILYRPNSRSGLAAIQGPASYGASQAGGIVRYRIDIESAFRPETYLRATTAISQNDRDIALGFSARPIGSTPLRLAAELRYSELQNESELRPAVIANTEVTPISLPANFRAEVYAQAGYIGGRNSTGFIDGQATAMRQVVNFKLGTIRIGGGAWGGAQKGAARVDVGPAATFDFEVSDVRARLQVDYRLKVAGDAQPGSGPAITLATGF